MAELWFGQSGVTLSQHADVDDRFPGWQENFGAGTFLGNDDFPNDDASHIQVDEGFSATLRQHGPSDDRYPGIEYTYDGPTTTNLPSDFNDELSELEVTVDSDSNQGDVTDPDTGEPITDDGTGSGTDDGTNDTGIIGDGSDVNTAGIGGGDNTLMYVAIGAVVLVAGYMLMRKKK